MFARVLLDHDGWRVTADWFGRGALRAVNRDKFSVKASEIEQEYLQQVLQAFHACGVDSTSDSPALSAALLDFAKAIHQRFRRANTGGGFAYTVFFNTYSATDLTRNYLDKFRSGNSQAGTDEL